MRSFSELACSTDFGQVAGIEWAGAPGAPVIIALHGWLDNAASFIPLANYLKDYRLIALDLPGHGFSDHKPVTDFYALSDYVRGISQAIDNLDVGDYWLLGHSLGAIVGSLMSLTEPAMKGAICLDAIGGVARESHEVASGWKDAIAAIEKFKPRKPSYAHFDDAVTARENSQLPVTQAAAVLLCSRGLLHLPDGRWTWRNDKALMLPGAIRWDEMAVLDLLRAVDIRTLVVMAESGWMTKMTSDILDNRMAALKSGTVKFVPGGHHFHMDDAAEPIADLIQQFIASAS
jgi:pimeloyl-ACP methyl ester carboxylesterase